MALDLGQFDEDARPKGKFDLSDLKDGDYEIEIVKATKKDTVAKKTNEDMTVVTWNCMVLAGPDLVGVSVERPTFIKSQESFNMALADLKKLGFDCDEWKRANNRPASAELEKALLVLPGMRFKGQKKKRGDYHNLDIVNRITDGKPEHIGPAELDAAAADDPFSAPPGENAA